MFSSRRLPKRSIIGTRICSTWQDGRFYPGLIQSTQTGPNGDDLFIIRFDDGFTKLALERDIIGPGFQNIITAKLKHAQKVFVTHNGREVSGLVLSHEDVTDEVLISITFNDGSEMEVTRRLEDVRLLESRKSARLQDQDTDYSRLADVHPEPKKRAVSQIIEVPQHTKPSRRRKNSPDVEESMECEVKDEDEDEMDNQMDTMDEHMAAMVLTSLSCSPQSPQFPGSFTDRPHFPGFIDKGATSPGPSAPGSSVGSSGVFTVKSEPGTPSPPRVIAHSAPNAPLFGTPPIDEGIELDDTSDYFADDIAPKKRRSTTTMFKCTWRDCGKVYNSTSAIESHVRQEHLGPKDESDSDLSDSDHEEEFYYIEVEVTVDNVIETFADMRTTSSPPQTQNDVVRCIQDHDYQKKEPRSAPQNIPTSRRPDHQIAHSASTLPFQTAGVGPLSRSWQATTSQVSPPARLTMSVSRPMKAHHLASSPKSSPMHKKSRSEVKKCRKVYGMENRDMWCTQCKWKKACSRFHE